MHESNPNNIDNVSGMHLSAAIYIIRHQVEVLKGVELLYSDQVSGRMPCLFLISLIFDLTS